MKYFLILLLLISIGCLIQCKSNKTPSPEKASPMIIKFGSGGGFSGGVISYNLSDSGKLWEDESSKKVLKVDKNRCKQIFQNYQTLGFSQLQLNEPGNLYHFITMLVEGEAEHKITWGNHQAEIAPELELFYNNLNDLARQFNAQAKP